MASAKKVAPLLIGGGLIYLLTKASNAIQTVRNLSVQLGRIKNVNFKGLSIDVTLELQVNNPGSVDIPFEYYTGTITHAGSKISSFTFNGTGQNIVFKRYSLTPVSFVLSISSVNLVYQLVQLITDLKNGRKVDSVFYINSTLHTTGVDIPVNFSYDIKPGAVNGLGKIRFGRFIKKAAGLTPLGLGAKLFHKHKHKGTFNQPAVAPAAPVAGIGAAKGSINRTWFKNQLRKGNFLYRVNGKYTDDYAYDNATNFSRMKNFIPAPPTLFNDWYLSKINIYGDKDGMIDVSFAHSEYYDFVLKSVAAKASIGKPSARLEFSSNQEMEKHFGCKDRQGILFSKN